MDTRSIGRRVEEAVLTYLLSKGYKNVCSNWTCRWGEIDLIVTDGVETVFVEVKYRSGKSGIPEESMNYFKKRSLFRAVNFYLLQNSSVRLWRFDLVCVEQAEAEKYLIRYYKRFPLI